MTHMTAREVVEQRGVSHRTLMRMIEYQEIIPAEKVLSDSGRIVLYLFDSTEVERAFTVRNANPPKGGRPRKASAA